MSHEARNVGDVRAMMEPQGANDKHTIGVGQLSFGVPWGASWGIIGLLLYLIMI